MFHRHLPQPLLILLALLIATGGGVLFDHCLAQISHPHPVHAQITSRGISAIPPREGADGSLRAKPGEKIQANIRVMNSSDQPMNVRSFAQDFVVENGRTPIPVIENTSNRWSLAAWMTITPNFHTLAPKETAQLNVIIAIPEDALPGGHYAMVVHEPTSLTADQIQAQPTDQPSGASVSQKVGTLFYVTVEGQINEEAYLEDFTFNNFQEFGPVPYSFKINNQSDIHLTPQMNIDIFNLLGQKKESLKIEPQNIFPLNRREFAGKWDKIWGFGLYKAQLTASYGTAGKVIVATVNFWILPIRIIIAILLIILIIIAILSAIKRHYRDKYQDQQAKINELQAKLTSQEDSQLTISRPATTPRPTTKTPR